MIDAFLMMYQTDCLDWVDCVAQSEQKRCDKEKVAYGKDRAP